MSLNRGESDRAKAAFPSNFFDALNSGDKELALRHLKAEARTPEGVLSPKAAEYNKQGEWDSLMGLPLVYLGNGHCGGRPGQDGYRVCAKAPGECAAKAHAAATKLAPGWYIGAGGRSAGCFAAPMLPPAAAGGPLTLRGAGLLTDGEDPFKLTKGQWQFVLDAWWGNKGLKVDTEDPGPTENPESPVSDFERVEVVDAGVYSPGQGSKPGDVDRENRKQMIAAMTDLRDRIETRLAEAERAATEARERATAAEHNCHKCTGTLCASVRAYERILRRTSSLFLLFSGSKHLEW
jgi:hypothetical protein